MRYDDLTVVLPTLNEKGSIAQIVKNVFSSYRGISVVVSDDGSRDGTRSIVKRISARNRSVKFLDRSARKTKGLSASVIDGIRSSKTKYVIVMDADLQHPVAEIAKIKRQLDMGNEIVVAARESVRDWQLYRKVVSKILIGCGYIVLAVRGKETCSDIFSGYFGINRGFFLMVENRNRKRFVGEGYKVLFDLLKCINKGHVKIAEVPYAFDTRKAGKSKAGFKQFAALVRSFYS